MITITDEMVENARKKIAEGRPEAGGYRLMVFTIDAVTGMEASQVEKFEHLAARGFTPKTDDQADREPKGSHYGVLLSNGNHAVKAR